MIARLSGKLIEKQPGQIVIDVGGVGYLVSIPLSAYYDLGEEGDDVSLHIYTHVKEDTLSLFGFANSKEKSLFQLLIQISGIGPKLGITILSGLPAEDLARAVTQEDLVRLTGIPGIGKKTAERIVLEIKEKMSRLLPELEAAPVGARSRLQADVVSALVNLGYPRNLAEKAVKGAAQGEGEKPFDELLRAALKRISG